jgi:hypothetical protein
MDLKGDEYGDLILWYILRMEIVKDTLGNVLWSK